MNTIKSAIKAAAIRTYPMRESEISTIASEISNATHAAAIRIHAVQCDAVENSNYTPAARVEMVLQLQRLSDSIQRAGFRQAHSVASR